MANDQKAEDLLNLALDTPYEMRERSKQLDVGYDRENRTWELIVKYSGNLKEQLLGLPGVEVVELMNEYAILTVPESLVNRIIALPQIEYVEKPKRLYFAVNQGKAASCIPSVQTGELDLSGRGVIVAVIDSGIDYYHGDFRNEVGSTRVLKLWDQSKGQIYTREEIDEALAAGSREAARQIVDSVDLSGHGTAVAGIAAGNGRESGGRYRGVAYESDLLVVKLGAPKADSFPRTTELMTALDFVVREAAQQLRPVVINISFGNTYGSHDGRSLLEAYIDDISNYGRSVVVIGTGNEGNAGGHTSGVLSQGTGGPETVVELSVAPYETGFSVQLWKSYEDVWDLTLVAPDGERSGPVERRPGPGILRLGDTEILLYYGEPSPYSMAQEIYMDFLPRGRYVDPGIWKFILTPETIVNGNYNFWLPSSAVLNLSTRFLQPSPDGTLTIPSTAQRPISVGAYDDSTGSYADFSGRGYTQIAGRAKPDLVAPGVNIITVKNGGGYEAVTGTSFAAPFVSGGAALMMEWGIVRGEDPYLYGEKVKAYLRKGARRLPGFDLWPNPLVGYGALCVRDSLPL